MTNIVTKINEWQTIRRDLNANQTLGFIPTMGYLHEGHLSLCKRSKCENALTVVSIFVNPTQFNQLSDFEKYPRDHQKDIEKLINAKVDYVFIPDAKEMYRDQYEIQVSETSISKELEGEFRPGHFNGMLTVVLKLLNLMKAHHAYFGEKDYQQYLLVNKMAQALFLSTKIIACETIRAKDGLALSSRNVRLNAEQREKAAHFPHLLSSSLDIQSIIDNLENLNFKVDYITEKWGRRLGAVWLDEVRLIDNIQINKR